MPTSASRQGRNPLRPRAILPFVAACVACGDPLIGRIESRSVTTEDLTVRTAYALPPFTDAQMPVYLTIDNTAAVPDSLLGVTTSVSGQAMLHGGGMEGMAALVVPAGGTLALRPGQTHLMLEPPLPRFARGDSLQVTLRFARTGTVTIWAHVIDYSDLDRMR